MMKPCLRNWVASGVLFVFGFLCPCGSASGQSLQESLDDLDVGEHWRYNDWNGAREAAAHEKKPIFALFR